MPVLFGNTYVLPAIIVVVLLLLLLLILMMRKRAAGSVPKTTAEKNTRPPARSVSTSQSSKTEVRPGPAAPTVAQPAVLSSETTPATADASPSSQLGENTTVGDKSVIPPAPAPSPLGSRDLKVTPVSTETALKSDPLRAVILDILQGWGDLVEEDTKRLAVFRPEKIVAALEAIDLPKDLRSNQTARNRLARLRHVAADLAEQENRRTQPVVGEGTPSAHEGASGAASEVSTQTASAVTPPPVEPMPYFSLKPRPAAAEAPAHEDASQVTTPLETAESEESTLPALDEQWTTPATLDDTLEAASPLEVAPVELVELELPVETAAFGTLSSVAPEPEPGLTSEAEPMDLNESPVWQPPGKASLPGSIKTADELFTLPAEEWADMVAFLEPAELSRVFERTDDPGLKKAIIDTLEHVSSPASLEVLRRCLDDPDPQIQLYALEAADRLLGVD